MEIYRKVKTLYFKTIIKILDGQERKNNLELDRCRAMRKSWSSSFNTVLWHYSQIPSPHEKFLLEHSEEIESERSELLEKLKCNLS